MIESLQWSATDDQLMSSTWTSLRPSTQSHTTSLSPNHKDMDLKGGLFSGYGISWTDAAKVVVNSSVSGEGWRRVVSPRTTGLATGAL